jgi:broad specificity phosphatase PhoE
VIPDDLTLAVPAADLRLVLVRHAETPSNVRRILDTVPPGPGLTDKGGQQAILLADRLATEKVHSVHASRALRAQETAHPVAARHGLEVTVADGAHEISVGSLEGSSDKASLKIFEAVYAKWLAGDLDEPMPQGETGRQALARFLPAVHQAMDGASAGAVVMVSHGALLRLAAAYLASNLTGSRHTVRHLPNTGVIVLEPAPATDTGWLCVGWDGLDLG